MQHKRSYFGMLRILLAVLTSLLVLAGEIPAALAAQSASPDFAGSGTLMDPYLISSLADFQHLRDQVDSGEDYRKTYFTQTVDLTLPDGENWNPIGDVKQSLSFRGFYDGGGHTISNIRCVNSYASVFSLLSGEVRNLGIESGRFEGACVGSIASHGSGNIINCYNKAEVVGTSRAGGLTDNFNGKILFSWNLGSVSKAEGTENAIIAGITSYGQAKITRSYTTQANPVSSETFTGELKDAGFISEGDIAGLLHEISGMIEAEEPESILNGGGVALMKYSRGNLTFGEYESVEARYLSVTENRYNFEGEGTSNNPFLIQSLDDLKLLRDNVDYGVDYRDYYFKQTADITFPPEENWNPIGSVSENLVFRGYYNGNGHVLLNFHCSDNTAGFFSLLGGEVRNLGIESGLIEGNCIGSITSHGTGEARIINCYNKAKLVSTGRGGGLTDNYAGQILFSWNFGPISGTSSGVVTAGITSYGSANIKYTYTTTDDPVSQDTFTGQLQNAGLIEEEQIPELLKKDYAALALQDRRLMSPNNIVFLTWTDGNLSFFEQIPGAYTMSVMKIYIPVTVLVVIAVALLAVMFILRGRRKSRKQNAAAQSEETVSSESDPELEREPISQVKAKRLLSVALTLAFFLGASSYAFEILTYDHASGIHPLKYWKSEENAATNVLFIGSSKIATNLELSDLWKYYGIAGFCIGAGESLLENDYYRLIEACKSRIPSAVAIEVSAAAQYKEHIVIEGNRINNYGGMPISVNKLRYVNATIAAEERVDYFLDFPLFHHRYFELNQYDYQNTNTLGRYNKGGWGVVHADLSSPQSRKTSGMPLKALQEKEDYFLRKIILFCADKNIPLILIGAPMYSYSTYYPYFNTVSLIAKEYGVPYLDTNLHLEKMGIVSTDYNQDATHLGTSGARKFTAFLGRYLQENLKMHNHKGMTGYETWDYFACEWDDMHIQDISDNGDYFRELSRDSRRLIAISYKIPAKVPQALQSVLDSLDALPHNVGKVGNMSLGGAELSIKMDYASCSVSLRGKTIAEITSSGLILVVYDDTLDKVADVVSFSSANGYAIVHET